ncbi:magnesium transporter [Geoglobus sp.]
MELAGEGTFRDSLKNAWKITLPALLISLGFNFVSGTFLGKYFDKLMISYPVLLVVLPGLMGLRGNIFGSLASRFTTALYLGEIQASLRERRVGENIYLSVILSVFPIFLLWIVGTLKTGHIHMAFFALLILFASTVFVSLLLGYSTAIITIVPFRRGLDPDSIASPLITSMADLLTIPILIFFILMYEYHELSFYGLFLFSLLIVLAMSRYYRIERRTFFEVSGILLVLSAISSISGGVLQSYSELIHRSAIVSVIYPALLGSLGNYGGVVAAKTSTRMHLGYFEGFFDTSVLKEILALITTGIVVSTVIYSGGYIISERILGRDVTFYPLFIPLYIFIMSFVMLISAVFVHIFHRFGLDPDNVSIPTITTIADLIGTVFAVSIAWMIGGTGI